VIETRHLSKLYSRGLYALRDLTISVRKGEFVFLTGPSGAGKMQTFGFLVGQVMKGSKGKANPKLVNDLLKRELERA
jgi:cell division transport system ATP-binding protein